MRVAVLTPTKRYGGLDVVYECLKRQTYKNFRWIVCDELFDQRIATFTEHVAFPKDSTIAFDYIRPPKRPEGYYSNLPAIYNEMIRIAREGDRDIGEPPCELAVSLQDYIWIPDDGIERFVWMAQDDPDYLYTGLCSMSGDPAANAVHDPKGLWTIFDKPYVEKPKTIEWPDVRAGMLPGLGVVQAHPVLWEMNWAAWPLSIGPIFDESYGEHIGHENQQFAADSKLSVLLDKNNHALSLPHRHYFPWEWSEQQPHRDANMETHRERYGW